MQALRLAEALFVTNQLQAIPALLNIVGPAADSPALQLFQVHASDVPQLQQLARCGPSFRQIAAWYLADMVAGEDRCDKYMTIWPSSATISSKHAFQVAVMRMQPCVP